MDLVLVISDGEHCALDFFERDFRSYPLMLREEI
jgi:hypothetical protein